MMNSCSVKILQEPSIQLCTLWAFVFVGMNVKHEPELNPCGSKCLWPNLGCCVVWYGVTMLILLKLIVRWKSRMISFEKIKLDMFLNGQTTYQSHMLLPNYKPSAYGCLWPIEFCQSGVTLGRIFPCSYDRDVQVYGNIFLVFYVLLPCDSPLALFRRGSSVSFVFFLCSLIRAQYFFFFYDPSLLLQDTWRESLELGSIYFWMDKRHVLRNSWC